MAHRDPEGFLDPTKLERLTMQVGSITHEIGRIRLDAGEIIKDGCVLVPPDRLRRKTRLGRWHRLYPARELVYKLSQDLRHAAARLEAEYQRTEEGLCGLGERSRRRL